MAQKGKVAEPVTLKTAPIPPFKDEDDEEETEEQTTATEAAPTQASQGAETVVIEKEEKKEEAEEKPAEAVTEEEVPAPQEPASQAGEPATPRSPKATGATGQSRTNGKNGKGNTLKTDKGKTAEKLVLGKGEKLVGGNVQKTIYMTLEQYQVLRATRRGLEDQTEQDVNAQDIIRYLIENATLDQFGKWDEFIEASRARDRRRKNTEAED